MSLSDQTPLETGFHAKSTASEVLADIDLTDKTAIVTGGYSGIGLETVRALAEKGAKIIVPVRSREKAADALAGVAGDVSSKAMDLGDIASVRAFAAEVASEHPVIDILICNAGIMACPEARIGDGWESQFGICHMGHFALVTSLMEQLEASEGARIVALSSTGHKLSGIRWDDMHFQAEPYDKWVAYGQAKTANALFANALSRRLKPSGGHAFSVHPGGIFTPLQRHLPKEEMIALGWLGEDGEPSELAKAGFKSPEQGASTTLWAATSPALNGHAGVYCEDCNIAAPSDPESETSRYFGVEAHAADDAEAERLWEWSANALKAV
ncbi:oxidoreductase [Pontivivens insulae]|uniref:Probable oxidoreductase n=1 Tax=Pontivivens insulae TaxID=1639689 RepID=A0A2R8A705_9RHOB|nr:oxidoreductase [Pontivivens insulae]RED18120.1 NAD(P)-dependent dehydrogenase (short-subunit alcohol dehydrogenase family) [Pontivivens insulae]SPF28017.1 2,3-dihydro-2,3-dihydroxybenzoate dehydrogenase [Pontivivens insulae]